MKYLVNRETKEHVVLGYNIMEACPPWEIVEADDEGWIKWEGGECPLPDGATYTTKSLKWREGFIIGIMDEPQTNYWGADGDINAYRPILPAESKPEHQRVLDEFKSPFGPCPPDAEPTDNVFKRFNAAVAVSESIPALIAEINAMLPEGYEVREKAKTEQPAEDMSDWRSWREGDLIMYCGRKLDWWTHGDLYRILMRNGRLVIVADDNDEYGIDGSGLASGSMFKFHSRPVAK